jgi:hypothetical protein
MFLLLDEIGFMNASFAKGNFLLRTTGANQKDVVLE